MKARFLLALLLAFGSLFFVTPAEASDWQVSNGLVRDGSVQFDYRGGSATQTLTVAEGSTLTITVNNTIANCIGACQPLPDTWSLTINGERWDGNTIDIMTVQTIVSGEVTITATGIDVGFWAGWYGPIFSAPIITAPNPVETGTWEGQQFSATAPDGQIFTAVTGWYGAPNDPSCGADVSAILATLLGGNTFTVSADNGVFGDPCGGVVKVLRVHLTASPQPSTEPIATPQPTATPEPTQQPAVTEPIAQPTPTAQPSPEPSLPSSQDAVDPIVPTMPAPIEPITSPPAIEPQPQPQPLPFPVIPQPIAEPQPQPTIEPTPEPTIEPTPEPTAEPTVEPTIEPEPILPSPEPSEEAKPEPKPIVLPVDVPEPPSEPTKPELKPEDINPQELSAVQVAVLTQQAEAVLESAPQGSPEYNQALEMLLVVAQADDPEVPAELASIPLLGNAAVAVLDAFNNLGNLGADMSPKQRKVSKKEAIATIAVGTATTASTVAAAGSVGFRRKETK